MFPLLLDCLHVGSQLQEFPRWNSKLAPIQEGQGKTTERADYSRLVNGTFNKQGNLHRKLAFGGWKKNSSPHLPTRILRVHIETLKQFSPILYLEGLNNILFSPGCVLEVAPSAGTVGGIYIPRTRFGVRSFWLPKSNSWINWQSHLLHDLLQHDFHLSGHSADSLNSACPLLNSSLSIINQFLNLTSSYLVLASWNYPSPRLEKTPFFSSLSITSYIGILSFKNLRLFKQKKKKWKYNIR